MTLVLGMHRSGTSMLANILHEFGVDMTRDPMANSEENSKGFWERYDVTVLNDSLLHWYERAFADALHVLPLPDGWHRDEDAAHIRQALFDCLDGARGSAAPMFGLKDPRVSIMLPLYRDYCEAAGLKMHFILAVRHPAAVAKSLEKRNGTKAGFGYVTWLLYNLCVLRDLPAERRLVIEYEQWFENPIPTAQRAMAHLGFPWPEDDTAIRAALAEVVSDDLRHNRDADDSVVWAPAVRLFRALQAEARGEGRVPDAIVEELWQSLGFLTPAFEEIYRRVAGIRWDAHLKTADLSQQLGQEAQRAQALEEEMRAAQGERDVLRQKTADLSEQLGQEAQRVQALEEEMRAAQGERDALRQTCTELEGQLARLARELAEAKEELQREGEQAALLRQDLAAERHQHRLTAAELDHQRARADADDMALSILVAKAPRAGKRGVFAPAGVLGRVEAVDPTTGSPVVRGWALAGHKDDTVAAILVCCDKGVIAAGAPSVQRNDVTAVHGRPEEILTGFEIRVPHGVSLTNVVAVTRRGHFGRLPRLAAGND